MELRGLAPQKGEAVFVTICGTIVRATSGFLENLTEERLTKADIAEILSALFFGQNKWFESEVTLQAQHYKSALILVRLAPHDALARLPVKEREVAD